MHEGTSASAHEPCASLPTLIFTHGGFCDRHDWDVVIERLRLRYTTLSFDLPGHGASKRSGDASIGAFAEAVNEVRRQCGKTAVLIGHSAGCRVVLEAVHQRPDGVAGVILLDAGQLLGQGDPAEAVRAFSEMLDQVGFTALMRAGFEQATATADVTDRERIIARLMAHDPQLGRDFLLSAVAWDAGRAASVIAGINAPLLIVEAIGALEAKEARPSPWSQLVLGHAREASLCCAPGGHFVMLEHPDLVSEHIDRFALSLVKAAPSSP
ncbi:MAG: alpha/beta fold hydrolase [Hyphomonadaceae bacterium]